jgi:S-DNA-T family DNA segregation ATPase FtsK/SpoIIIE
MTRKKTTTQKKSTTSSRKTTKRKTTRQPARPLKLPEINFSLDLPQKALISGVVLIFLTGILILSFLSPSQGELTKDLVGFVWRLFGWGGLIVPVFMAATGLYLVLWGMGEPPNLPVQRTVGLIILFITFESFASFIQVTAQSEFPDVWAVARVGEGGGYFGGLFVWLLTSALGSLGTVLVLLLVGITATVLVAGLNREEAKAFFQGLLARRAAAQTEEASREILINPGRPTAARTLAADPASAQTSVTRQPKLLPVESNPEAPKAEPAAARNGRAETPTRRGRPSQAEPTPQSADRESIVAPTPIFIGNQTSNRNWRLPAINDMLEAGTDQEISNIQIREQVEIIEHTLDSFGAPASVVEINQGPTITQYGVEPSFIEQRSGKRTKVKVGKIASLADDLALALAARSIRIQAPVPGKGYVGIEVPNMAKAIVSLRDVMESEEFQKISSPLRIGLGQNVAGQPIATDLTKMPHLLIAGTTGAGKSVCVNGIIACLLLNNTPENLKLVMVDPKRVELTGYNGIPHLIAPVVVDMERVVGTLQWAMREMDNRYQRLADIGARNIVEYNKKAPRHGREKMPYIVIIVDELADLMMLAPEDTERGITRLAQMSRATGIHMIIATQRPSVDVVTGLIKANFPARIAFAVASSTDSRVILDATGAERLLGQGDMLFQSPDAAAPVRMQGCFVNESELHNIIEYWHRARIQNRQEIMARTEPELEPESSPPAAPTPSGSAVEATTADQAPQTTSVRRETPKPKPKPSPPPAVPPPPVKAEETELPPIVTASTQLEPAQPALWEELEEEMKKEEEEAEKYSDELLPEAIALVRKLNKASTSLLQRRFRIGYTRAARMMDIMEEDGIIGPPTGTSKAREVLSPNGEGNEAEEEEEK